MNTPALSPDEVVDFARLPRPNRSEFAVSLVGKKIWWRGFAAQAANDAFRLAEILYVGQGRKRGKGAEMMFIATDLDKNKLIEIHWNRIAEVRGYAD